MRNRQRGLGFGIFLLIVGAVWLLSIAGIVTAGTMFALAALWPLILVVIGISFIFRNNGLIRSAAWLILVAVIVCYGYFGNPQQVPMFDGIELFEDKIDGSMDQLSFEKKPNTEKGELSLDFGAARIDLDASSANLLDAEFNSNTVRYNQSSNNRKESFEFEMSDFNIGYLKNHQNLNYRFHLNRDVVWELDLDTGAVECNLNLENLKVEKLNIDTGASSIDINMGSYDTELSLDAGASKIDITLPEDTGLKIKLDGGVNNSNLNGAGWEKDGDWRYSPNYNEKKFKVVADVSLGLGKLTVK